MQYILLIYHSEADYQRRTDAENQALMRDYMKVTEEIKASGHWRAGERLQNVDTATTVRVREGKVLKTDGPFAETREQLGGYYIVEAKDLDEATAIAARLPGARLGSVEVRPFMAMPAPPR
ncbi:MAG TPA: YciI family protein [Polyangiales bacterium]|nr:YciI family protein [Polyangiales bacterium]